MAEPPKGEVSHPLYSFSMAQHPHQVCCNLICCDAELVGSVRGTLQKMIVFRQHFPCDKSCYFAWVVRSGHGWLKHQSWQKKMEKLTGEHTERQDQPLWTLGGLCLKCQAQVMRQEAPLLSRSRLLWWSAFTGVRHGLPKGKRPCTGGLNAGDL